MIKVDGGFAKVVNVMPFHGDEDTIELTIYIKLFCADEEARYELVYALEEHEDVEALQKQVEELKETNEYLDSKLDEIRSMF